MTLKELVDQIDQKASFEQVMSCIVEGWSIGEILEEFPGLTQMDLLDISLVSKEYFRED